MASSGTQKQRSGIRVGTSIGVSVPDAQVLPADRHAALLPVNPVQLAYAGTQSSVSIMERLVLLTEHCHMAQAVLSACPAFGISSTYKHS